MARPGIYLEDMELEREILKIFEELIEPANGDSARSGIAESAVAASRGKFAWLTGYFERIRTSPRHRSLVNAFFHGPKWVRD